MIFTDEQIKELGLTPEQAEKMKKMGEVNQRFIEAEQRLASRTPEEQAVVTEKMGEIKEELSKTHQDKTPFLVNNPDQLAVIGDASKTAKAIEDYVVKFRAPASVVPKGVEAEPCGISGFVTFEIEREGFGISPREMTGLIGKWVDALPILDELVALEGSDAKGRELTKLLAMEVGDESLGIMIYDFVGKLLRFPEDLYRWMEFDNVLENFGKVVRCSPNFFQRS